MQMEFLTEPVIEGGMKEIPGLKCAKVPKAGVALPRGQRAIDV
jgi:hypothetical protein